MSSSSSRSKATKSTKPTSDSAKPTKAITPYSRNFEQHMIDHGAYRDDRSQEPVGMDEILEAMTNPPRASLSPSRFEETAFKAFRSSDARAKDEDDVLIDVVPYITGPNQNSHFAARKTVMGNLESLTSGNLAPPNPDLYYGARPETLDREVRDVLSNRIIPSTADDKPMAPNFFMEVKGPHGSAAVVALQALYDGAIGARAMHALQNYGAEVPAFDGRAYTISSTYHAGTLKLYAHQVTPPTEPGGRPEYHMTQLRGFALTSDRHTFVQGVTAFRNARDWAKGQRDRFIEAANARARQSNAEPPSETDIPVAAGEQEKESTDEFVGGEDDLGLQAFGAEDHAAPGDVDEEPALPPYPCAKDQELSQESTSLGAGPTMSFVTSFTSFSQTSSKRTRASHSPPSNPQPLKKHG